MHEIEKKLFKLDIYGAVAENRMARRNFSEALEHNSEALSLRRETGLGEDSSPSLWGQRAAILWGLGRVEECYQEIGRLAARKGQGGLGISLLRQAIELFDEVGNLGAVAAAQGTLGDIWLELGEHAKARELYENGLAYWQVQKHPRWTAIFEERQRKLVS